jgi:hypothetical protein
MRDIINRVSRIVGWPKVHLSDTEVNKNGTQVVFVSDGPGPHDMGRPGEPRPRSRR